MIQAIANYEALIESYSHEREKLTIRRRGAADHVMVELDERLDINEQTIEAFRRALEMSREHLKLLERDSQRGGESNRRSM